MTRPTKHLGLLVSSALAFAVMMASAAWAGDRYGSAEPQAGDYAPGGYGYPSQYRQASDDVEQVDPCAMQSRVIDRGCEADRRMSGHETRLYSRDGGGDAEQIDPCAMQHHLIGRGCESDRGVSDRETRRYSREQGEDAREVDPCAMQYHVIGRGCSSDGAVYDRETRDRSAWRSGRTYEGGSDRAYAYDRAYAHDRFDDQDGYVDAREAPRERFAEPCPCQDRRAWRDDERVVWVEERLPESFFFSDGGVGPGIVDFGGGGGGGGESSIFIDSSARADASASASAMASAYAAAKMRSHGMKMPYGQKMPHYGGSSWGGSGGGHWK